jgi:hypothetical protein
MNVASDRPLSGLVRGVIENFQEIVRSEVRLAKAETREEVQKATGAAKMLGVGAALAAYALGFVLLAGYRALAQVIPDWLAALAVGGTLGIIALVCYSVGKERFKRVDPKPEKTIESIKENLQWNRNRNESSGT